MISRRAAVITSLLAIVSEYGNGQQTTKIDRVAFDVRVEDKEGERIGTFLHVSYNDREVRFTPDQIMDILEGK